MTDKDSDTSDKTMADKDSYTSEKTIELLVNPTGEEPDEEVVFADRKNTARSPVGTGQLSPFPIGSQDARLDLPRPSVEPEEVPPFSLEPLKNPSAATQRREDTYTKERRRTRSGDAAPGFQERSSGENVTLFQVVETEIRVREHLSRRLDGLEQNDHNKFLMNKALRESHDSLARSIQDQMSRINQDLCYVSSELAALKEVVYDLTNKLDEFMRESMEARHAAGTPGEHIAPLSQPVIASTPYDGQATPLRPLHGVPFAPSNILHPGSRQLTSSSFNTSRDRAPRVPRFDGKISGQFLPWYAQFRAIAKANDWDDGEKALNIIASLDGSAANLLIGMSDANLDNYSALVDRLKTRFDPPKREHTYRTEFGARMRRRNENADEFAEALKSLAQRAYPSQPFQVLDDFVADRFRAGQTDLDLKQYLSLYPSSLLTELIGACVRYESTTTQNYLVHKPAEGIYAVQAPTPGPELTYNQVEQAARRIGLGLRPINDRQTPGNQRGNNYQRGPQRNQASPRQGNQPGSPPRGNTREFRCWHCNIIGHRARECRGATKNFDFAPGNNTRMNVLQVEEEMNCDQVDQVDQAHYSEPKE